MNTAAIRLQDRDWRRRNSLWIAGAAFMGILAWASFLYIGLKANSRKWLIASAVYAVLVVPAFAAAAVAPRNADGSADTSSWQSNAGTGLIVIVWFVSFVHAIRANREWLRFRANQGDAKWYDSTGASEGAAQLRDEPAQVAPVTAQFNIDAGQFYSPQAQTTAEAVPTPTPTPKLIDVNSAGLAEFLNECGLDVATAERIIVRRTQSGGFSSMPEFVTASEIPPHIFATLRSKLTLRPLQQDPQDPGLSGRVLDY